MSGTKLLFGASLLALVLAAGPAFAFSTEPTPINPDGSTRFADPDELADHMSDEASGANAGGGSAYGLSRSGAGVVTPQGALRRPYDPNDPTTHP